MFGFGYSDYNWEQLARAVQQQLKLEAAAEVAAHAAGVEPPLQYIRDPGGSSVLEYLLDHDLVAVQVKGTALRSSYAV